MKSKLRFTSILRVVFAALVLFGSAQPRLSGKTPGPQIKASPISGMGSLSGTVKAPKEIKAAEVYASNLDKHVVYMVYTAAGRYRALGLLPGQL